MIYCPECGADRRAVPPIAPCPRCGVLIGEAHEARPASADNDAAATTAWRAVSVAPAPPAEVSLVQAGPPHPHSGPPLAAPQSLPPNTSAPPAASRWSHSPAPVPGTPAHIPITPQSGRIVIGVLLMILSGWLLLSYLPENRPLSETEQAELILRAAAEMKPSLLEKNWLRPDVYNALYAGALLVGLLGIVSIVQGATWRAHKEVTCRGCGQQIVGKKEAFGVRCPLEGHTAEYNAAAILGFILFCLVIFLFVVGTAGK